MIEATSSNVNDLHHSEALPAKLSEDQEYILLHEDFDPRSIATCPSGGGAWKTMKERYPLTPEQRLRYFECECGAAFKDFELLHDKHEVYCDAKKRAAAAAEAATARFHGSHFRPID